MSPAFFVPECAWLHNKAAHEAPSGSVAAVSCYGYELCSQCIFVNRVTGQSDFSAEITRYPMPRPIGADRDHALWMAGSSARRAIFVASMACVGGTMAHAQVLSRAKPEAAGKLS